MVPSSFDIGWFASADRSTMASLRKPKPTLRSADTHTPPSLGPRWTIESRMTTSLQGSTTSFSLEESHPTIPHMTADAPTPSAARAQELQSCQSPHHTDADLIHLPSGSPSGSACAPPPPLRCSPNSNSRGSHFLNFSAETLLAIWQDSEMGPSIATHDC